jgi:hypothetical protein
VEYVAYFQYNYHKTIISQRHILSAFNTHHDS